MKSQTHDSREVRYSKPEYRPSNHPLWIIIKLQKSVCVTNRLHYQSIVAAHAEEPRLYSLHVQVMHLLGRPSISQPSLGEILFSSQCDRQTCSLRADRLNWPTQIHKRQNVLILLCCQVFPQQAVLQEMTNPTQPSNKRLFHCIISFAELLPKSQLTW